ncbi:pyrroline-5-carboxylate reductase family protein [Candidatus Omnitrophota bacterium]
MQKDAMNGSAIGIIGYGNMGSAIGELLKSKYQILAFDKDKSKTSNLQDIKTADSAIDLVNRVGTIILAVKPQDFEALLVQIKESVGGKLAISIAAGITTGYIEKLLGRARVIRVMPNIGAKIGKAESVLSKGKNARDEDMGFVQELFNHIGKTWIMKEQMIDAATAISGSGPAYIYYDMEVRKIDPLNVPKPIEQEYIQRLTKAAERVGFDSQTAVDFASSTTGSSLQLAALSIASPVELRKQITSKGGTTEAALKVLVKGGSWEEAAEAAKRRAGELSKG